MPHPLSPLMRGVASTITSEIGTTSLQRTRLLSPKCPLFGGFTVVPFVKELTSEEHNIIGIAGYFCHNIARQFTQVLRRKEVDLLQLSATSIDTELDSTKPSQHSILSLSQPIAKATAWLLQSLNWTKVAIVSSQETNFLDMQKVFLEQTKESGIEVALKLETTGDLHIPAELYFQELQRTGVKIVVSFLPVHQALDLLCVAHVRGFVWPIYAWIFAGLSTIDESLIDSEFCIQKASVMNGALFVYPQLWHLYENDLGIHSDKNSSFDESMELLDVSQFALHNPYTSVLYDSVWTFVHTLNRSLGILSERHLSLTHLMKH